MSDDGGQTGAPPPPQATGGTPGRLLLGLVVGQLGVHAVMAGLRLASSLQALREGHSAWAVGLLLALFAAAPVLISLPAGRLTDRLGYHRPVLLAVASTMLGALLAVLSTWLQGAGQFGLLCAAAVLVGAGTNIGMLTIQRAAGLAANGSVERVRVFSWLGVAPPLSNVVGPVMVGFVIDAAGFRAAYLALDGAQAPREIEHPEVARSALQLLQGLRGEWRRLRAGAAMPALGEGAVCETCEARGLCRRDHWAAAAAVATVGTVATVASADSKSAD